MGCFCLGLGLGLGRVVWEQKIGYYAVGKARAESFEGLEGGFFDRLLQYTRSAGSRFKKVYSKWEKWEKRVVGERGKEMGEGEIGTLTTISSNSL